VSEGLGSAYLVPHWGDILKREILYFELDCTVKDIINTENK
jgi:hypothetical protein